MQLKITREDGTVEVVEAVSIVTKDGETLRQPSGPTTQARPREMNALARPTDPTDIADVLAVLKEVDWSSTPISEVVITASNDGASTIDYTATGTAEEHDKSNGIWVCFGAPSTEIAKVWLTEAESLNSDSNRYFVEFGERFRKEFDDPITKIHAILSADSYADITANVILEGH
jgi:hypothetical protein